ncbi:MAG TPA: hypothetical protein VJH23_04190 [archaeon]|nr:hypothetical protein [archaeon]
MQASAQSPGHITGFFVIYTNGSTGAGINIADGMKTTVSKSAKDSFFLNGKKSDLPVSRKVLEIFMEKTGAAGKVKVAHSTKFPIGYGLGISGAGALSLALALNRFFKTNIGRNELTQIAKRAEIECGTGLGDVIAENYAGLLIGKKPYPSKSAERIKCHEKYVVMGFFRPIKTKKIIRSAGWKKKINKIGISCMQMMQKNRNMENFIGLSRIFTIESGLSTQKIRKVMEKMDEASMSMLGETVFVPTNEPEKTAKVLSKYCKRTMIAKISHKGAGLL